MDVDGALPEESPFHNVKGASTTGSMFWGNIATEWAGQSRPPIREDITCPIPLPALTAQIFTTTTTTDDIDEARPKPTFIPKQERAELETDDVFVVSQLGKKGKKRPFEDITSEKVEQDLNESLHDMEDEERLKKQIRQAKKEKKRLKELEKQEEPNADEDEYEPPAPFDYANAPSLLGSVASNGDKRKKPRKEKGKTANPYEVYSKGMNTAKGLGKRRDGGGGKSVTFTEK
jgi:hypothetical protein